MIGEKFRSTVPVPTLNDDTKNMSIKEVEDSFLNNQDTYFLVIAPEDSNDADFYWVNSFKKLFTSAGWATLSRSYIPSNKLEFPDPDLTIYFNVFNPEKAPYFWSKEVRITSDRDALSKYKESS